MCDIVGYIKLSVYSLLDYISMIGSGSIGVIGYRLYRYDLATHISL